ASALKLADAGKKFEIADSDPRAFNDPDAPQRVDIVPSEFKGALKDGVEIKPLSVTLFKVDILE
ncbi:MAG: hypothetical protein IJU03_00950, partial [Thermoguttaceae bacterium]|nr:hypothetical protein [Thermoguttaceae bacterium]